MISLEILSKDGTIDKQYNGENVALSNEFFEFDAFERIMFTGEQVWICKVSDKGEIKPLHCVGFIYKAKTKER